MADGGFGGIQRQGPFRQGEAIACASLPAWPNASFRDSVYRWEDEEGRISHGTYQEIWFDRYHQAMKREGVPR